MGKIYSGAYKMSEQQEANEAKPVCPRCGDMFYHPKVIIQDTEQRAKEWEEEYQIAAAKLAEGEAAYEELKEQMSGLENKISQLEEALSLSDIMLKASQMEVKFLLNK